MIEFSIEVVTPSQAAEWLKRNTCNRSVRRSQVEKYKRDIMSGRWYSMTAEPIKFNCDGTLLDGQHRLIACVDANTPFTTSVARGIPKEAMLYLDSGEAKDAGDILQLKGHANTHQLAAAASTLLNVKAGGIQRKGGVPRAEIVAVVDRHPRLVSSVTLCCGIRSSVSPSLLSAIHYIGVLMKRQDVDAFIEVFRTGVPRGSFTDPAFSWRERVIRSKVTKGKNMSLTRDAVFRGTIHAFNLNNAGREVKGRFVIPDSYTTVDGLDVSLI